MTEWLNDFIVLEETIIDRIDANIETSISLLEDNPSETDITHDLLKRIQQDRVLRQSVRFRIQGGYEPSVITKSGAFKRTGIMDIVCFIGPDNSEYLGIEAKKLNYTSRKSGKFIENVDEYVENGIKRFVVEKYSKGLPIACMLGYVMDGKLSGLQKKIIDELNKPAHKKYFSAGPVDLDSIRCTQRFETKHKRSVSENEITLRHSLLNCKKPK